MAERNFFLTILIGATLWLFVTALTAFMVWPLVPSTWQGWLLFVVLAPPLYILAELGSERLLATKAARSVSEHPSRFARIFFGVLFGSAMMAVVMIAAHMITGQ